MNVTVIIAGILCGGMLVAAVFTLKDFKWSARSMARIGLVSGLTIVLYMIKLVPFPQGGGSSLLSILPIMILAVLFGRDEAMLSAIVVAFLKLMVAPPIYPMQIPLDYFGAMMAVPFVTLLGTTGTVRLLGGGIFAAVLSTFYSILSGVIFFGQYAPEGMHPWVYSTVYNVLGYGVEAALSVVVLILVMPVLKNRLQREVA